MSRKCKYQIRVFQCSDCGARMYAPKGLHRMTCAGHVKTLWCPWCKEEKQFIQVE